LTIIISWFRENKILYIVLDNCSITFEIISRVKIALQKKEKKKLDIVNTYTISPF